MRAPGFPASTTTGARHRAGLPCRIPARAAPDRLIKASSRDKKEEGCRLCLILIRAIGDVFVANEVSQTIVSERLKALKIHDDARKKA